MASYALRSRLNDEPNQKKKNAPWRDVLRRAVQRFRAPPIKPYTRMTAEELDRVSDI